jgi:hypothetical protein
MSRWRVCDRITIGRLRVNDRRVLRGIVFVNRNGLRWRDAPRRIVPARRSTIVGNAGARWAFLFRMMETLAAAGAEPKNVMIDATYSPGCKIFSCELPLKLSELYDESK